MDDRYQHERLEVWQLSRKVLGEIAGRRGGFAGSAWLYQQAIRAAGSVALNVAEGASLRAKGAKNRHYGIALGSCGELGAALDVATAIGVAGLEEVEALNRRVAQMLNKLSR